TATGYVFHQVKGRKSSQGPWKFSELFGVSNKKAAKPSKTPASVTMNAILPLMLLHHKNFGDNCAGLAFVTNAGIEPAVSQFLDAIGRSNSEVELPAEEGIAFRHIARAYMATDPPLATSASELFKWFRGLLIHTDQG